VLEKLNKKSIKYKLRRKTLENLKGTLGLKGEGTKDSPVIIDDLGDVCVEFSIRTKETYLVLKNLNISTQQLLCRSCFFENNSVLQKQYNKFLNNTDERRSYIGIWILLVVGVFYSHIGVSSLMVGYLNFVSIILLLSGVLLSIAMIYELTLRYQANKIPQNEYLNFAIQEIEAFSNAFIKVV
jgi:hypothetical protein